MPTMLATDRLTAIEAVKRNGVTPDERRIIEAMRSTNEILADVPVFEANNETVHKHLVRTSLPKAEVRLLNAGVGATSSTTKVVVDPIMQLATYSRVDASLVKNAKDPNAFLTGEEIAFIEGMGQQQAELMIYGDANKTGEINGMATRRAKLESGICFNAGGSGNALTSLYIARVGREGLSYIHPKGASGIGVSRQDDGIVDADAGNGKKFKAYQSYFQCDFGLSLGNEKALLALRNIAASMTGDDLIKEIITLSKKLPAGDGAIVVYANGDLLNRIDLSLANKGNVNHTVQDPWGKEMVSIRGIRLRQVDAILNTESAIS